MKGILHISVLGLVATNTALASRCRPKSTSSASVILSSSSVLPSSLSPIPSSSPSSPLPSSSSSPIPSSSPSSPVPSSSPLSSPIPSSSPSPSSSSSSPPAPQPTCNTNVVENPYFTQGFAHWTPGGSSSPTTMLNCGKGMLGCADLKYINSIGGTSSVSQTVYTGGVGDVYGIQLSYNVKYRTTFLTLKCTLTGNDGNGNTLTSWSLTLDNQALGDSNESNSYITSFNAQTEYSTLTCQISGSTTQEDVGEVYLSYMAIYKYC
ncbi:hypothetical protein Sste5346_005302 [Sporothrix stenoceras]|uniref:Ig-like domain-containing protein n=1 Tax=Sporothrix stenoceras TaxID=5173 RepID=A0ABR3Z4D4_9PEZI